MSHATHSHTLLPTATRFNTLQHTAKHVTQTNESCNQPIDTHHHILQHTATSEKKCNRMQHTATHRPSYHPTAFSVPTATHCNTLQHTATHCNTLLHTATHCNTMPHTATQCHTLQRNSVVPTQRLLYVNCNTLQHTATHCNARTVMPL